MRFIGDPISQTKMFISPVTAYLSINLLLFNIPVTLIGVTFFILYLRKD